MNRKSTRSVEKNSEQSGVKVPRTLRGIPVDVLTSGNVVPAIIRRLNRKKK
jgi:hypothetical protein